MKKVVYALLIYTLVMLTVLAVILILFNRVELNTYGVGTYTDEELSIYKNVWNNINSSYLECRNTMLTYTLVLWGIVLLTGYILVGILYINIIKPIRNLENLAGDVARGNLDVALPMNRNPMFTGFNESFDLMREELKSSKVKEMEAEKAKKELVVELSHDIKTPVATIQATCEVMDMKFRRRADQLDESGENDAELAELRDNLEKIDSISAKADTISGIMNNVFHVTMEELEHVEVNPKETSSTVLESCFNSIKNYGNIILEEKVPECLVYMDKLRMEQVIDNVVGNSHKYAGTDIHVRFEEFEGPVDKDNNKNRFLKVVIRDEGPGVREEDLPLITEKYYRGAGSDDQNGFGLGMYLVKTYMEMQGGGIEYYNDNGFVVELIIKKV